MNQEYLQLYADFIVKVGVNVRPRQNFIIRCPVTMPEFAHACAKAGYEAGAKEVIVRWEDERLARMRLEYGQEADLCALKPYELRSYLDYAEDPDGCCTLAIHAEDPEAFAGLDAGKLNRVNLARRTFMKPWQEYTMNDRVQWCVAAVPAPSWAAKVFPGIPVEEAMEKLWALIFDVCRVSTGDPVAAWREHVAKTKARRDQLNAWELESVRLQERERHRPDPSAWPKTPAGKALPRWLKTAPSSLPMSRPRKFSARRTAIKSTALCTAPSPTPTTASSSKAGTSPLRTAASLNMGRKRTACCWPNCSPLMKNANRIGEIAFVPASSPINRSGVLFYDTLFDENAGLPHRFRRRLPDQHQGRGQALPRRADEEGPQRLRHP